MVDAQAGAPPRKHSEANIITRRYDLIIRVDQMRNYGQHS